MAVTTILSIQSSVAFGHVGNSAATFPLMRLGVQVWPVYTVHFSNHTGYGAWRGPMLRPADVTEVVTGMDERGALTGVDAVLSGYQGAPDMGQAILGAVELVRSQNPGLIYCCDPVIGDVDRGIYVRDGIPQFIRDQVIPAAQIITPNHFELDYLTGAHTTSLAGILAGARQLQGRGPGIVLVTSAVLNDTDADQVHLVAVSDQGAWQVSTPRIGRNFTGSGDLTAALFLANCLASDDLGQALGDTAASVYSLLRATADLGSDELALVVAQNELVNPSHRFEVNRLD